MSKTLKEEAAKAASYHGFSSVQEAIRVLLTKFSQYELDVAVTKSDDPPLSKRAVKRYEKIIKDIKAGRNIVHTESVEDFLQKLRS